jgi:hypothetical protein
MSAFTENVIVKSENDFFTNRQNRPFHAWHENGYAHAAATSRQADDQVLPITSTCAAGHKAGSCFEIS